MRTRYRIVHNPESPDPSRPYTIERRGLHTLWIWQTIDYPYYEIPWTGSTEQEAEALIREWQRPKQSSRVVKEL